MALTTITSLYLLIVATLLTASSPKACQTLLKPNLKDAGTKPPTITLTKEQIDKGTSERACLKSYSSGFPGGEAAFLKANSQSLHKDLVHLESLFTSTISMPTDKSDPDWQRKAEIKLGWDREQVLLWGNFFYIRQLYQEGAFEDVLKEVSRVRKVFGLEVHPLAHWDKLEDNTYYSKQSLRNMIAVIEYRAHAKIDVNDPKARIRLATEFIENRDALKPFFDVTGDPTTAIVEPYCQLMASQ